MELDRMETGLRDICVKREVPERVPNAVGVPSEGIPHVGLAKPSFSGGNSLEGRADVWMEESWVQEPSV